MNTQEVNEQEQQNKVSKPEKNALQTKQQVAKPQNAKTEQELKQVFSEFNRIAQSLDESYQHLEGRVSLLKKQLSEARLARRWDQAEKDQLANRLASLVSAMPNAVVVVNRVGLIIDRNPLASEAFEEPLIGLPWREVMQRQNIEFFEERNEISLADGRIFSVAQSELALSNDCAIFFSDVTDIHRAQRDLERKKRLTAMGEMASGMAHQIRTPLSSAHLYMSPLSRAELDPEERISLSNKVQERLAHIGRLIDSMLSFVRGSREAVSVVPLTEILEKIPGLVAYDLDKHQAKLNIDEPDSEVFVRADIEALSGAMANLVINAFELGPENPEVRVVTEIVDDKEAVIHFLDNGPGIKPEQIEKIFDPFFTTRATGTGLGLSVTAMTCREHGGSIRARNQAKGGAEFIIKLPVMDFNHEAVYMDNSYQLYQGMGVQRMNVQREIA